jgi:hypothetical protein
MSAHFGTKAETLAYLAREGFPVPPLVFFTGSEWKARPDACLAEISAALHKADRLAVRSSAFVEDAEGASLAGAFRSVLNIPADVEEALRAAVEQVCATLPGSEDQIIVQTMVEDVAMSGVLMTRALDDGSPYYVVNYDDVSGRTDTVTGGKGGSRTVFVYRGVRESDFDSPRLLAVVRLARDLEKFFGDPPVDMEFAVDGSHKPYLLQARPIAAARNWRVKTTGDTATALTRRIAYVAEFVERFMTPRHGLWGKKSILGVMPDWNPAEMIGVHPRPLAASLYRELITRDIWQKAREAAGYRPLPPTELMVMVAGTPYIDVRASFNSFLPRGLTRSIGDKLVNAWLDRLDAHPAFHDKVEFAIVPTVLTPDFEADLQSRCGAVLTASELAEYRIRLMDLTRAAFDGDSLTSALSLSEKLRNLQENRLPLDRAKAGNLGAFELSLRLTEAVEQCRTLGTLPFAVAARHGFIAETWLRAAERADVLSGERLSLLKRSMETVAGELTRDFHAVLAGQLSREDFLHTYGHLRPGSYDILSPSYRERTDLFAVHSSGGEPRPAPQRFAFTRKEKSGLEALFASCGLALGAESFLHYVRNAVAGRENVKFIFTRHLDHILHLIKEWGKRLDFSPEEVSLLSVDDVVSLGFTPLPTNGREYFLEKVSAGRHEYETGRYFKMAYLIRSSRDVYIVPQHRSQPNFIGIRSVEADVVVLTPDAGNADMEGKIVCIEGADPGYDWIFTRSIAGLITRYGGANSHMAIRCAEYGLPAAIGCGGQIFETAVAGKRLRLDCAAKTIRPAMLLPAGTAE